jgi:hypothetical protein
LIERGIVFICDMFCENIPAPLSTSIGG